MFANSDHTFALCAYRESPYLGECLQSLRAQTAQTSVIAVTSTPCPYIEGLCAEFGVPLFVNPSGPGISTDWNFALSSAGAPLVTIAHQDDVYEPRYAERMLEAVNGAETPLLFFTNYGELREGARVDDNPLLRVKRAMLAPLKGGVFKNSRFVRRRILSFGSAICCPSVTLVRPNLPDPVFQTGLKCNLDWQAWERASRLRGAFLYDPEILMYHRIHEESETTALIRDHTRSQEDLLMFERFWPHALAVVVNKVYGASQKSNG